MKSGETILTQQGIETTPYPRIDWTTNRRAINTQKREHKWLLDNALRVAEQINDEWNLFMFGCMKIGNLSDSDLASLNDYLFGGI